jgi:hypothetical protein
MECWERLDVGVGFGFMRSNWLAFVGNGIYGFP